MTAYLGLTNILESGTVTVTNEQTDFEKENAYDWFPNDWWLSTGAGTVYLTVDMGSNTIVDWWGLAFHDLSDNSGTIKPQYSTDNFAADTNDLDTIQTPSDGSVIFRKVTSRNVRYYRFEIASTGSPSYIGALWLGQALVLPENIKAPFVSPKHGRNKIIINTKAEGGSFIGRSVQQDGYKFDIAQKAVTHAWADSNWATVIDHIEIKPFFFVWDQENRPTEAIYAWTDGKIAHPSYTDPDYLNYKIPCKGLIT